MDPRFLEYYHRELQHLAEMCGEFAEEFPKIAGRLSLDGFIKEFKCPDPYVERLLEAGFGCLCFWDGLPQQQFPVQPMQLGLRK